jgi:hypothetical protein
MIRFLIQILVMVLMFAVFVEAAPLTGKFEGIWKSDLPGTVLTILSDHPPRGTLTRGEGGASLYIQDPRIVKGALHFKTIDPSDGVLHYELKVISPTEATLAVPNHPPILLKHT